MGRWNKKEKKEDVITKEIAKKKFCRKGRDRGSGADKEEKEHKAKKGSGRTERQREKRIE